MRKGVKRRVNLRETSVFFFLCAEKKEETISQVNEEPKNHANHLISLITVQDIFRR